MTSVTLLKKFFPDLKLAELKALTADERKALADEVAKDQGLVGTKAPNGSLDYQKAA